MNEQHRTYTRRQAQDRLGIKSKTAFHHLRRQYPQAFIVIHEGSDRANPTLYDAQAIDKFADWRNQYKG